MIPDNRGLGDFVLIGCQLAIMLPVFRTDIFRYNAFQRRQLGQGIIDHFRAEPIFFGVAPRTDSPDVHHRKPLVFDGALDFPGKILVEAGASADIRRTGGTGDFTDIQGALQRS